MIMIMTTMTMIVTTMTMMVVVVVVVLCVTITILAFVSPPSDCYPSEAEGDEEGRAAEETSGRTQVYHQRLGREQ